MIAEAYVYHSSEKGWRIHHAGGASRRAENAGLSTDSEVGMTIDDGCLIIEPQKRPRYSLRPAQNYRYGGPERIPDAVVNEVLARLDAILY